MTVSTEDAYKAAGAGWVETQYGRFDPMHPVFDIRDIAHSLGQLTRYNGHGKFFYSVAEHSVMVSRLIGRLGLDASPFAGLMHDATEAYLSDVPAPFKQYLPDLKAFDSRMEVALRAQFGIPEEHRPGLKRADWLALFIEAYDMLPSRGEGWTDPLNLRPLALELRASGDFKAEGWAPKFASREFQRYFNALQPSLAVPVGALCAA